MKEEKKLVAEVALTTITIAFEKLETDKGTIMMPMCSRMKTNEKVSDEELLTGYIYTLASLLIHLEKKTLVDDKHIIGFQDIVRKGFERDKFVKERLEGHDDLVNDIFSLHPTEDK